MRFTVRLTLAMAALVLLTTVVIGAFAYRSMSAMLAPQAVSQLGNEVRLTIAQLDVVAREARADVLALADSPGIDAIGGLDAPADPEDAAARRLLAGQLLAQVRAKPDYLQFRMIGAATGRELVRADRSGEGGAARVTPESQLQFKGERTYVQRTETLAPGEVHVSAIELNQEHGVVEVPHTPVLRLATPATRADGAVNGIVVVNVDMGRVFAALRDVPGGVGALRIFDRDGGLLVSPDRAQEFAAQLGGTARVQDDFPELAGALAAQRPEARLIEDREGRRVAAAMSFFRVADGPLLGVLRTRPYAEHTTVAAAAAEAGLPGLLLVVVAAVGLAAALARSLARPVERISAGVEAFRLGRPLRLTGIQGRETGQLARSIERMAATIEETTSTLRDEVEQRRRTIETLNALAARERLFRAAFESSDDAILTLDLAGRILFWNPAAERLYGWTAEEMAGRSPDILVPPDRAGETGRLLDRLLAGETIAHFDTVRLDRHGRALDVSLSVSPVRSPAGELIAVAKIARDITERKHEEEMFRLAIGASPAAMILIDAERRIQLANAAAARIFGHAPDAMIGQRIERLIPDPREPAPPTVDGVQELQALRADGVEFPVEVTLTPITSRDEEMVLVVVIDIGPRLEAKARIAAYTEDLKRSNAELEQFAYIAAHDLQEPLRMVASYAQLLSQRYSGQLDERADRYIAHAVDGSKRMKALIDDLLAFSRVGSQGRPLAPVEAGEVASMVAGRLRARIDEAGGTLEIAALPQVMADEVQLAQLFQNLLSNALKFRGEAPPRISIAVETTGADWTFSVADNGIGIEPDQTERIFQMFQRLHERGKFEGSGIGLAVARKIVERHRGRIWVEPGPDGGSIFRFTLPVIGPDMTPERENAADG